jgi:hypothetical protein
MDTKASRLIAAGRHDAPAGGIAADDDGLTSQLGMVPLLHGGEKGIHVHMDDLAGFDTVL